jgi:hypothetical protein
MKTDLRLEVLAAEEISRNLLKLETRGPAHKDDCTVQCTLYCMSNQREDRCCGAMATCQPCFFRVSESQ